VLTRNVDRSIDALDSFSFSLLLHRSFNLLAIIALLRNMAALSTNKNGDLAQQLAKEDWDPFKEVTAANCTAFQLVSKVGDLEAMLAMAAKPGTQWTARFLLSRNKVVEVPMEGRESIPLVSSPFGPRSQYASMEGLEVMMMYGYKLKENDLDRHLLLLEFSQETPSKLIQLALATSVIGSGNWIPRPVVRWAFSIPWWGIRWNQPSTLQLVRILLKAGAKMMATNRFLFDAVDNRDEEMLKLLVSFGIASNVRVCDPVYGDSYEHSLTFRDYVERAGLSDLLIPPDRLEIADPAACVAELRKEFEADIKKSVPDHSSILVVAAMRNTGLAPPLGLMSKLVLEYTNLGFDLWKLAVS